MSFVRVNRFSIALSFVLIHVNVSKVVDACQAEISPPGVVAGPDLSLSYDADHADLTPIAMSDAVIENPILNAPFREPARHWASGHTGITNEIVEGRRVSSYFMPMPA